MLARLGRSLQLPASQVDTALAVSVAVLLGLGLVMVGSASVAVADRLTGEPLYYFYRQSVHALIGLAVGFLVVHIPMRVWQTNSFLLLALGLALLLLVLLPGIGVEVNGARRWLELGIVRLQASEPARLCLLLYLAGYAARRQLALHTTPGGLLKPVLPMALACLLLLLEPDYGASAMLFAVGGLMLFLAGARLSYLVLLAGGAGAFLVAAAVNSPYRLARLVSFTDPWAHPFDSGFQLTQSLIAIGRGEIAGVGLGNSVQKLLYLPETHTDFLFAILAEEFGLLGSLTVLVLFALVVWRGFAIAQAAMAADQPFGAFVAYGLSVWIGLQAAINVAVTMGLLPTKGLTLPLMSYGGSSLVTTCVMVALLLRVDMETRAPAPKPSTSKRRRR